MSGLLLMTAIAVFMMGCASEPRSNAPRQTVSRDGVDEIHLFGVPVCLNLDDKPGPDGFAVTLYASRQNQARGIPIRQGTVTILMFDGAGAELDATTQAPLRAWTFSASDLKNYEAMTAIGTGYRFALRWEQAVPSQKRITIFARHSAPRSADLSSMPSVISVTPTP